MCLLFSPLLLRSMYRSSTYRYPTSVPWPRDWDAERLECSNKWVAVDVSTDKLDAVLQALLVWLAQIPICPAQLSTSQFNSGLLRVLLLGRANVHPIGHSCSCFLIWGWCAQKGNFWADLSSSRSWGVLPVFWWPPSFHTECPRDIRQLFLLMCVFKNCFK